MIALVGYAIAVVLAMLLGLSAVSGRRAVVEQRKHAIAVLRAIRRVLDANDAGPAAASDAIRDLLHLEKCWFEPGPKREEFPTIEGDGTITALVQHQVGDGIALPPLTTIEAGPAGRFVLIAGRSVGTTVEQRIGAATIVRIWGTGRRSSAAYGVAPGQQTP